MILSSSWVEVLFSSWVPPVKNIKARKVINYNLD